MHVCVFIVLCTEKGFSLMKRGCVCYLVLCIKDDVNQWLYLSLSMAVCKHVADFTCSSKIMRKENISKSN